MRHLVLLIALVLAACASSPAIRQLPDLAPYSEPGVPGKATVVVIYADEPEKDRMSFDLSINQRKIASIHTGQHVRYMADPGATRLAVDCGMLCGFPPIELSGQFESGRTYYFYVTASLQMGRSKMVYTSWFKPIDPSVAHEYLSHSVETYPVNQGTN